MPTLEEQKTADLEPSPAPLAPTDGELLMGFVRQRKPEALASLIDQHASMVLGVCRQILRDPHEAEDAFQATFLILAQRAGAIEKSASVGAWLHRVAYRTAMRAARRRQDRRTMPLDDIAADDDLWISIAQQEQRAALHEELARLPERYRGPLVLCYLEGKTRSEAADALERTDAAVKASLARGKRMLRMRLARRGISLAAVFGLATLSTKSAQAALPSLTTITAETVSAAVLYGSTDLLTSNIGSLAREGIAAMKMTTALRMTVPLALVLTAGAALLLTNAVAGQSDGVTAGDGAIVIAMAELEPPRDDLDDTVPLTAPQQAIPDSDNEADTPSSSPTDKQASEPPKTQSEEIQELSLEREYYLAKIAATKLFAEAKAMETKRLEDARQRMIGTNERSGRVYAQDEIAINLPKITLSRAEEADLRADIIKLRLRLMQVERTLHWRRSLEASVEEAPSQNIPARDKPSP